jgi:hypothetical protein
MRILRSELDNNTPTGNNILRHRKCLFVTSGHRASKQLPISSNASAATTVYGCKKSVLTSVAAHGLNLWWGKDTNKYDDLKFLV